jgi:sulfate permease, SulP family
LTVAVEAGLLMACAFFILRMSTLFTVKPDLPAAAGALPGVAVYRLYGSLFFGAVAKVEAVAENLPPDTRAVVLEMHRLVLIDTSGLDALEQLHRTLKRQGVLLLLCDLNEQPLDVIRRAEFDALLGEENLVVDLPSALARAAAENAISAALGAS